MSHKCIHAKCRSTETTGTGNYHYPSSVLKAQRTRGSVEPEDWSEAFRMKVEQAYNFIVEVYILQFHLRND